LWLKIEIFKLIEKRSILMPQNEYVCRVCGYINDEITWEKGIYPTYNICPCCGVEFGYEDSDLASIRKYRERKNRIR